MISSDTGEPGGLVGQEAPKVRPGIRVMRGATLTIPPGALRISADEDGTLKAELTHFEGAIQTWTDWLSIAFARLQDAKNARKRLTAATKKEDESGENAALSEEFQSSLQAISGAVFALDAFYGVIESMIRIPDSVRASRQRNNEGRAVWVSDAIGRASRLPNDMRKSVDKNIHAVYRLRDGAVHPSYDSQQFFVHPGLNQGVHKYYADYTLESTAGVVAAVAEAIMCVTDRPQPRNKAVTEYAPGASTLLHEIVDGHLNYSPSGPFNPAKKPQE